MKETIKSVVYGAADIITRGRGIKRRIGGYDIRFPSRYSRYYPAGYEPGLFKFIERNCPPGSTFLDCGAHFGLFSVVASRVVSESGKVIAFEPMPDVRATLESVVSLNNCVNVKVRAEAVSLERGKATFYQTGNDASNANSLVKQDKHGGGFEVDLISIDEIRDEERLTITCVKIDVEGAEYELLRGASETLRKDRPVLFLSLHPTALDNANVSLSEIWTFLIGHGYSLELEGEPVNEAWFSEQTDLFDVECIPLPNKNSPDDPSA
ncbi:MAG: FkbM family methyltransferase [Acidobacteria bacterium]|nr:FkbM family methyltransferase [Acidobacteriota bacterium]